MKLGEIYKMHWDGQIVRIIGFDDYEVFYDCYWERDNLWTFSSNLKKKCFFYRTPNNLFLEKADLLDFKGLTDNEQKAFRPDLVMRTLRIANISWADEELLNKIGNDEILDLETIETGKIWLYPFGPKGGLKKGELITAENCKEFTIAELIMEARRLQQEVNINKTDGVGIYRIGIQKQIPSYCIGEYFDLAGIMKDIEINKA